MWMYLFANVDVSFRKCGCIFSQKKKCKFFMNKKTLENRMTSGFFANHKVNRFHFFVHNFLIVFNILLNTAQCGFLTKPQCAKIDTAKKTS